MDPDELRSRLEALHPDAFGWALSCTDRDVEAARDVLQTAYLDLLAGAARWNGAASFRTWVFAVIRNKARDHRRRAWVAGRALARLFVLRADSAPAPSPESCACATERARILRRALARLSRRQREVLQLVFYHGLSVEQAAEVLSLSCGTARLHYERGKRRLRLLIPREMRG
jgi:RNA polymerase sigma-70 factor (ECF subfamily)